MIIPGKMIPKRSDIVSCTLAPLASAFSFSRRMKRGERYLPAAMNFFCALSNWGPRSFHESVSRGFSEMKRIPCASSWKAWTAPESITERVFMNSSTMLGRNCSLGFLTTVRETSLPSMMSTVNPFGMMTMAEAFPFFIFLSPSLPSVRVTRNIFFTGSESMAPMRKREARNLSLSTRRMLMGGNWLSSDRGAKTRPMIPVRKRGMAM